MRERGQGKRTRHEEREILRGRPFRASWAMGKEPKGFYSEWDGSCRRVGSRGGCELTWVLAGFPGCRGKKRLCVYVCGAKGGRSLERVLR